MNLQEEIDISSLTLNCQNTEENLRFEFVQKICFISNQAAKNLQIKGDFLFFTRNGSFIVVTRLFAQNRQLRIIKKMHLSSDIYSVQKLIIFNQGYSFIIQTSLQFGIWNQTHKFHWIQSQYFYCPLSNSQLISTQINENDDLIISGDVYGTFNFWRKVSFWEYQQMIQLQDNICDFMLNKAGNELIVIGEKKIFLLEFENLSMWVIRKVIAKANGGYFVRCFQNKLLACLRYSACYIKISQFDNKNLDLRMIHSSYLLFDQNFAKNSQIEYLESLDCFAIVRNNNFFLLRNYRQVQLLQNHAFVEQYIKFPHRYVSFTNSSSCDYMITNEIAQENSDDEDEMPISYIKIRKLQKQMNDNNEQLFLI